MYVVSGNLHLDVDPFSETHFVLNLCRDELRVVDHSVVVDVVALEDRVNEEGKLVVLVVRGRFMVVVVMTFAI